MASGQLSQDRSTTKSISCVVINSLHNTSGSVVTTSNYDLLNILQPPKLMSFNPAASSLSHQKLFSRFNTDFSLQNQDYGGGMPPPPRWSLVQWRHCLNHNISYHEHFLPLHQSLHKIFSKFSTKSNKVINK